jgi:ArsR family transcriptional regulator
LLTVFGNAVTHCLPKAPDGEAQATPVEGRCSTPTLHPFDVPDARRYIDNHRYTRYPAVVPRTLEIVDRQLGERCCDINARPTRSYAEATKLATELEQLANPVRLQLLDVLTRNEGRVCVCDLEAAVPVKQPTVSHHLRLLREAGLIESEKVGQWVYYRIKRDEARALRERVQNLLRAFA